MKIFFILILTPIIFSSENEINKTWCTSVNGNDQFITKYGTYVDCLTEDYAIEAEFD